MGGWGDAVLTLDHRLKVELVLSPVLRDDIRWHPILVNLEAMLPHEEEVGQLHEPSVGSGTNMPSAA